MEATKNPNGRTGIVGIGSLPNFGPNGIDWIFLVSPNFFIVSTGEEEAPIPVDYDPSSISTESLRNRLMAETGEELQCIADSIVVDSVFNTGLFPVSFPPESIL